jgi:hypothetical protein
MPCKVAQRCDAVVWGRPNCRCAPIYGMESFRPGKRGALHGKIHRARSKGEGRGFQALRGTRRNCVARYFPGPRKRADRLIASLFPTIGEQCPPPPHPGPIDIKVPRSLEEDRAPSKWKEQNDKRKKSTEKSLALRVSARVCRCVRTQVQGAHADDCPVEFA